MRKEVDEVWQEPVCRRYRQCCAAHAWDANAHGLRAISSSGDGLAFGETHRPATCSRSEAGDLYYFNFVTGSSTWEHPCDAYYK